MTHRRVAAYWYRTFNAGFLAMNPEARPSQPDPELILVVTKDSAYWLNDDATHCRRGIAAGWWKSTQRPAVETLSAA